MNIETLVLAIKAEIEKHRDIKQVDFGAEYDNDVSGNYHYPMCFIECQPVQRTINPNGTVTYSLAFQFLDKHVDGDRADTLRAQAVTERIMREVVDYFYYGPDADGYQVKTSGPALSVTYATDSIAAGWRQEIEVVTGYDRCDYKTAFGLVP